MSAPVVAVIGTNRQLDALTPLRAEYRPPRNRRGRGAPRHLLPPGAVSEVCRSRRRRAAGVPTPPCAQHGRAVAGDGHGTGTASPDRPRPRPPGLARPLRARRGRRPRTGRTQSTCDDEHRAARPAIPALSRPRRADPTPARRRRRGHRTRVFWWPADEIVRDDMTVGLGHGLAVALYVGHGRPSGWVGYAGVRAHHLADTVCPGGCRRVARLPDAQPPSRRSVLR